MKNKARTLRVSGESAQNPYTVRYPGGLAKDEGKKAAEKTKWLRIQYFLYHLYPFRINELYLIVLNISGFVKKTCLKPPI